MIFSSRNIVCTPSFQLGGGGGGGGEKKRGGGGGGGGGAIELKKGLDRALIFREGLVGKRRDLFFGGGPIFT